MSLVAEIHKQRPAVRYALFGCAVVICLSFVGFVWLRDIQEDMFMATHSNPAEREEFLAQRDRNLPRPLAAVSKGLSSLTANIGSLLGFDSSKGFDRPAQEDKVYMLPLSQ